MYDCENRIVKIEDDSSPVKTVATYAYDALGRRIEQVVYSGGQPSTTRRYYMGKNWQVLAEVDGDSPPNTMAWFIYGNYIDEVLRITNNTGTNNGNYYYLHDHLYSPVALLDDDGDVVERYEYDAYGACRILDDEYGSRSSTQYANPYLFTGRRLDILDGGSLKLQYNRNRYYDPETGRWLTHDPLGITPNPPKPNKFDALGQYKDGMNLYEYVRGNPLIYLDPRGRQIELWITSDPEGMAATMESLSCGPPVFPRTIRDINGPVDAFTNYFGGQGGPQRLGPGFFEDLLASREYNRYKDMILSSLRGGKVKPMLCRGQEQIECKVHRWIQDFPTDPFTEGADYDFLYNVTLGTINVVVINGICVVTCESNPDDNCCFTCEIFCDVTVYVGDSYNFFGTNNLLFFPLWAFGNPYYATGEWRDFWEHKFERCL